VSGVIAVLGFGEAGSLLAGDLVAAGATVRGYDPKVPAPAESPRPAATPRRSPARASC
jgi:3-hydroxyisobutyrate dehydrogenase-like beta-hydroxyacid dehydrogenase